MQFAYDGIGRMTSFTNADTKSIGYKYDAAGNMIELTYPDGKKVTYAYVCPPTFTSYFFQKSDRMEIVS